MRLIHDGKFFVALSLSCRSQSLWIDGSIDLRAPRCGLLKQSALLVLHHGCVASTNAWLGGGQELLYGRLLSLIHPHEFFLAQPLLVHISLVMLSWRYIPIVVELWRRILYLSLLQRRWCLVSVIDSVFCDNWLFRLKLLLNWWSDTLDLVHNRIWHVSV